jgi:hypothetical protein
MELKMVMNDHCKLLTKCCYFLISANQKLLWVLAAMLDDQSEQKVKKVDKDLARNISAKYSSNPSSGL